MRIKIELDNIYFFYRYDEKFIRVAKKLGCKWLPYTKVWACKRSQVSEYMISELAKFFPRIEIEKLRGILIEKHRRIEESRKSSSDIDIPVPPGLSLYPYQKAGVEFIINRKHVLLADEMGLGKTIQAIAYLNLTQAFPVVVICPASLKYNWEKEMKKWLISERRIQVLEGKKDEVDKTADVVILNYDIVASYVSVFNEIGIKTLILDEVHYIKSYQAQRTKAVMSLQADKIIALSGTPMLNRPVELWPVLSKMGVFKDFWHYANRYCDVRRTRYGLDLNGASHLDELAGVLRSTVMLRREKKDVLQELPEKIRTIIPLRVKSREISEIEDDIRKIIEELREIQGKYEEIKEVGGVDLEEVTSKIKSKMRVYVDVMEHYRILAAKKKLPYIIEFIRDVLEQNGEKLVVFCYHREIYEALQNEFQDIVVGIQGGDSAEKRQEAVDRFQNDEKIKLFVGSIRASAEGVTLTASSKVIFAEYDWTPARMIQAEDRVHRIGQKKAVNSYWFVLSDSIEENIVNKLVEKMKISSAVMLDEREEELFILDTIT
ncbi:MAG: DEAD/DEAH box helicase [Thermodesulfovibrio sp.]|nr:DEAD/DEAH box helicase [Thermodesulfovibrio sp.]